jgi:hypothetical protein
MNIERALVLGLALCVAKAYVVVSNKKGVAILEQQLR